MASIINASTSSGLVNTADTSGQLELQANGTTKLTVNSSGVTASNLSLNSTPVTSFAGGVITSGTAVASTSGTSINFTSIPSWVKRITVMLSGVSLSGTNNILVKLGTSGGVVSTGYNTACGNIATSTASVATSSAGFVVFSGNASFSTIGTVIITNITGNIWVANGILRNSTSNINYTAGDVTLSSALTSVNIQTNGADTFDAGTINILYEG